IMMFGLPAACLAMYRTALPARRKAVAGLLGSLALTSFLTGVTEPIEFSFMFLAPALYVLHALLTGLSMVVMNLLGVKLGFGFSAGLFDYVLSFGIATRPLLLLPVGAAYFAIYYFSFRWCILRFDLKTPGRERDAPIAAPQGRSTTRGADFLDALGGPANVRTIDACMTRLRLTIADPSAVDEARLKSLGARGMVRPGGDALQVVLGPIADQVAGEIRQSMSDRRSAPDDAKEWLQALGGPDNVVELEHRSSRLIARVVDPAKLDESALTNLGARGVAHSEAGGIHILLDPARGDPLAT
ncbi:MAG: glucose PTS transporter subunit EIIB, partial [Sphingomicrobium sp.]